MCFFDQSAKNVVNAAIKEHMNVIVYLFTCFVPLGFVASFINIKKKNPIQYCFKKSFILFLSPKVVWKTEDFSPLLKLVLPKTQMLKPF